MSSECTCMLIFNKVQEVLQDQLRWDKVNLKTANFKSLVKCEVSSKSKILVKSNGQDTHFLYVCIVILSLKIWPWVKVMTYPWIMNNNYVKYYQIQTL